MDAQKLKEEMAKLPEPPNDSQPPYWSFWRHDVWQRAVDGEDPHGFMKWPAVHHCMLINHWPGMAFDQLKEMGNHWPKLGEIVHAPATFYPADLHGVDGQHVRVGGWSASRNLIHQAYHFFQWERATGRKIADLKSIIEFGGGYGATALVASRMGFTGRYTIVDLPEFLLLQEFFLDEMGVEKVSFKTAPPVRKRPYDLLLGLFSISEIPIEERGRLLEQMPAGSHLFLYSERFTDYDNLLWFQEVFPVDTIRWKHPYIPNNDCWYQITDSQLQVANVNNL